MPEEEQAVVKQVIVKQAAAQPIAVKKRRPIRAFFKSFVDVKRWLSYDELKASTESTVNLFRRLYSRKPPLTHQETYQEAVARLHMTEEQLLHRKKIFLYSALIYGAFTLGLLIYFIYLLANVSLLAAFFDLILIGLLVLITYREHFWYMQMQKKKLGCNFRDWLDFILRRGR